MTPQLLVVILVAVGLVVFAVAVILATGRQARRRAEHVRVLAGRIGARVDRVSPAVLRGTLAGRAYVLSGRRSGRKTGAINSTHIEVPLARRLHLQIEPQGSDLGAEIAGDQRLGDEAFDAACHLHERRHARDVPATRTGRCCQRLSPLGCYRRRPLPAHVLPATAGRHPAVPCAHPVGLGTIKRHDATPARTPEAIEVRHRLAGGRGRRLARVRR